MFKNQPKGLIPAALSNMGERFGYYIMNAVLVLFLCSKFGLSEETSALVYSFFYAGIYVLSLVGGIIADRTQNYKGTIISGLIVMTIGYVVLAFPFSRLLRIRHGFLRLLAVRCSSSHSATAFSRATFRPLSDSCTTILAMLRSVMPVSRFSMSLSILVALWLPS